MSLVALDLSIIVVGQAPLKLELCPMGSLSYLSGPEKNRTTVLRTAVRIGVNGGGAGDRTRVLEALRISLYMHSLSFNLIPPASANKI